MDSKQKIISKCKILLDAYHSGKLGYMKMPEDSNPGFSEKDKEVRFVYFTLPMSLNYQRDSYKLWESVLETFNDSETRKIFDVKYSANLDEEQLRTYLMKHKIALQPKKHIATWQKISQTISDNWGAVGNLLKFVDYDFIKLKDVIQNKFKKGFPYLSGPKIFNYWSFIIQEYGKIKLKNSEFIEIAPDTHITKCSVILGVITQEESEFLTKEKISERWREILHGTGINPINMHSPLWFWSRNNFQFKLD
ncbi:MAG: hypothetical protein ABIB43_06460 [archaeon]